MPDKGRQKKFAEFFDRDAILEELSTRKVSFVAARRKVIDVYDALLKELYEEGCMKSAEWFACLVAKEKHMYENQLIVEKAREELPMLYALHENMKNAELASQMRNECAAKRRAFDCMYQNILILESYGTRYDWLLTDVFKIIINIAKRENDGKGFCNEVVSRIYFKYGMFLSKETRYLNEAWIYLERAMKLARGEVWLAQYGEWSSNETLHVAIGRAFVKSILKYAKSMQRTDPQQSKQLADRAMIIISEVGTKMNKMLYLNIKISNVELLILAKDYIAALKLLNEIYAEFDGNDGEDDKIRELRSELLLKGGICRYYLNEPEKAMKNFQGALAIGVKVRAKHVEATCLLYMGQLKSFKSEDYPIAQAALAKAKILFHELCDTFNKQRATYALSKLRSGELFKHYLDLIKKAGVCPCGMYRMRKYKNQLKPFWEGMGDLFDDSIDVIKCLLDEAKEFPVESRYIKTDEDLLPYMIKPKEPVIVQYVAQAAQVAEDSDGEGKSAAEPRKTLDDD